jgi:hypothetical protein
MNPWKRASLVCLIMVIFPLLFTGCEKRQMKSGEKTATPIGYYTLCQNNPESKLCKQ